MYQLILIDARGHGARDKPHDSAAYTLDNKGPALAEQFGVRPLTTNRRPQPRMDRAPGLRQSGGDPTANAMQPEINFGLAGRRAIVTGHKGGIGAAIAATLARDGAAVTGLDLPEFDLADTASLEARAAAVVAQHGPIDILVNNAGVTVLGSVLETPLAEVEQVFRVNFLAAYALMRAVLPGMAERRRGAIVNIASDQALIGKQVSAA